MPVSVDHWWTGKAGNSLRGIPRRLEGSWLLQRSVTWPHWMKEKNDDDVRYFIFASFHENHQLSAKMLLSVVLLFWGLFASFLRIRWQSQFFYIIFRSTVFLGRMLFVFADSFCKNAQIQLQPGTEYHQGDVLCRLPLIIIIFFIHIYLN